MKSTNSNAALPLASESEEIETPSKAVDALRECGIYETPDGRKFIASRFRRTTAGGKRLVSRIGSNSSYLLFTQYHWAFHGEPHFEVGSTGELFSNELVVVWTVDQLKDTGFTAGSH